jgi:hypothetical protein
VNVTIDLYSAQTFEHELLNPLRGHDLSPLESFLASLLLSASAEKPLANAALRRAVKTRMQIDCSERLVKSVIRGLRKRHAFPILSRRKKPSGYWWASSAEEMERFITMFRGQALDELHTLSRIVKENYPALAGQLRLEENT